MPRRIDAGEVLAALGGALVFVALFLEWFLDFSGWEAFESLDLVIAVLALVAVGAAVSSMAGWSSAPSPRLLPWVGGVLLAIVAVQLIEPPPTLFSFESDGEGFAITRDLDPELGAWLALAGAGLVLLGGILRAAHVSVTVSVGSRDVRRRVPAVDRRPAAGAPGAVGGPPAPPPPPPPPPLVDDQATQPFAPTEER